MGAADARAAEGDVVEEVYGMPLVQRTQCLSRKRPDLVKEIHTFQVGFSSRTERK